MQFSQKLLIYVVFELDQTNPERNEFERYKYLCG